MNSIGDVNLPPLQKEVPSLPLPSPSYQVSFRIIKGILLLFLLALPIPVDRAWIWPPLPYEEYFALPTAMIGPPLGSFGAEITPEGNLYTGFTEVLFLLGQKPREIHSRKKVLVGDRYPAVIWEDQEDHLLFRFRAYALGASSQYPPLYRLKIEVYNPTPTSKESTLWIAFRFRLPEESRFRARIPFNPYWKYAFQRHLALREGQVLGVLPEGWQKRYKTLQITSNTLSPEAYTGPFIGTEAGVDEARPVLASLYPIQLPPKEKTQFILSIPASPCDPSWGSALSALSEEDTFKIFKQEWDTWFSKACWMDLPDPKTRGLYYASLAYLLISADREGKHLILKVNELQYDNFWLRDATFMILALEQVGYQELAKEACLYFLEKQKRDGLFISQPYQLDGLGQALWTFGQYYRWSKDLSFVKRVYPSVSRAVAWLEKTLRESSLGLLPATHPLDNENLYGHILGNDFWAWAGLASAVELAKALKKRKEAEKWSVLLTSYRQNILRALRQATQRTRGRIPPALEPGGYDWGNLEVAWPTSFLPATHSWTQKTIAYARRNFREGLMTYSRPYLLHGYLGNDVAMTELLAGERERVLDYFRSLVKHTSSAHCGFELVNRFSRTFGRNLIPHGTFAGKFLLLLRSMLLNERENFLEVGKVLPPEWIQPGKQIKVQEAPTLWGPLSLCWRFSPQGATLNLHWEARPHPQLTLNPKLVTPHLSLGLQKEGKPTPAPNHPQFLVIYPPVGYLFTSAVVSQGHLLSFHPEKILLAPEDLQLVVSWRKR